MIRSGLLSFWVDFRAFQVPDPSCLLQLAAPGQEPGGDGDGLNPAVREGYFLSMYFFNLQLPQKSPNHSHTIRKEKKKKKI